MKVEPPFLRLEPGFDLALGKVLLTGVVATPSLPNAKRLNSYIKLSVKNCDCANQIKNKILKQELETGHVTIVKESDLEEGSIEYKMSLIIDTMLNIERVSKKTRQAY